MSLGGNSRLLEAEGGLALESGVFAYLEEDVKGFLLDFNASSTASATRLRWMILRLSRSLIFEIQGWRDSSSWALASRAAV